MIKAIIFDMDGVVINSEPMHIKIERGLFKKYNFDNSKVPQSKIAGMSFRDIILMHNREYGANINVKEIIEAKTKIITEKAKDFELFGGIKELFDEIKGRFKTALTTSSVKPFAEKIMNLNNLNFDVVVTTDDITKGKPDPEAYAITIRKLNLEPEECVVIEDSPNGIKSAKSAGAKCIAITNTFNKEKLAEADLIINSFNELNINKIKELGK